VRIIEQTANLAYALCMMHDAGISPGKDYDCEWFICCKVQCNGGIWA